MCIAVIVVMVIGMRVIRICSSNRSLSSVFIFGQACVVCDSIVVCIHISTLLTVSVVVAVFAFVTVIATYTFIRVAIALVAAPYISHVYGLSFLYIWTLLGCVASSSVVAHALRVAMVFVTLAIWYVFGVVVARIYVCVACSYSSTWFAFELEVLLLCWHSVVSVRCFVTASLYVSHIAHYICVIIGCTVYQMYCCIAITPSMLYSCTNSLCMISYYMCLIYATNKSCL